jgi:WD40 repeat protein
MAGVGDPANPVTALAFHPTSGQLASGGYGEVIVWDVAGAKLERRITGLIGRVRALAFSKDGKQLAIAEGEPGRSGAIRLLDFSSGNVLFTLDKQPDECLAVAFSPDGKLVAGGAQDGVVKVWTAADGKLVSTLKDHTGWITGVAFSPNGKLLAASSADRTAVVWFTENWKPLTRIPDNPLAPATAVAFSPDGTLLMLATGGDDEHAVRIWRTEVAEIPKNETPQQMARRTGLLHQARPSDVGPGLPTALAFITLPSGNPRMRLLVSSSDKVIKILNQNGGQISTLAGDTDWVDSVAASADGTRIASGSASGSVMIWNAVTGKVVCTLR